MNRLDQQEQERARIQSEYEHYKVKFAAQQAEHDRLVEELGEDVYPHVDLAWEKAQERARNRARWSWATEKRIFVDTIARRKFARALGLPNE